MQESKIEKLEKKIRYIITTIFLLVVILNWFITGVNNTTQFEFYNYLITLTFILIISIFELIRFHIKNGEKNKTNILSVAYLIVYLNIILLIIILGFHMNKVIGNFSVIFLCCFINFLTLDIIQRRLKKK